MAGSVRDVVVEFLTFTVPDGELAAWSTAEEQHWSRFLERQPGFVRKELWRDPEAPETVHAVIWWESMEAWKSVPQRELERVAAAMGPHERSASCVAYDVLRTC